MLSSNSGPRATSFALLYNTQQVADLLQDAGFERGQTPQAAASVWPGVYPAESLTPQVAQITNISKEPEIVSSVGLTPQVEEIVEEKKDRRSGPDIVRAPDRLLVQSIPPFDNAAGLQSVLATFKIKPNDDLPFFRWRAERTCPMRALCRDIGLTVDEIAERLRGSGCDFTRTRFIDDLAVAMK